MMRYVIRSWETSLMIMYLYKFYKFLFYQGCIVVHYILIFRFLKENVKKTSHHAIRKVGTLEGTWRAVRIQCGGYSAPSLACGQPQSSSHPVHEMACPRPSWTGFWGHAPSVCAQWNATARSMTPTSTIITKNIKWKSWV